MSCLILKLTTVELLLLCFRLQTGILGHENGPDVVTVIVKQGSDVILPCSLSTKERITSKLFDWRKDGQEVFLYDAGIHYNNGRSGQHDQFKGRVSHFPGELKSSNASIIIQNTRMEDGGNYTCDFPRLQPRQIFHIKLVVEQTFKDRSGEITGAASKPYITIVNVSEDGVQLKCVVRGAFPQPKLHWQDSDGNVLPAEEPQVSERGGHYNVSLYSTVTSTTTNRFSCVVKQENISHIVNAEITLLDKLFEDKSCPVAGALIGGWFSGALTVAAVWVLFKIAKYIMKHRKKDSPQTNGSYTVPSMQPLNPPV
ncbi:V-set and immunoglobulin domain-containing protein 1-like [Thunnus maccoyii]|uniref:V-set and immunoglobulin domain-containing protein 1-like n=1 Tax=Thunnus maccoyii TaxID=8240 RepID=UPI001C4D687A|nr:V-set and immunoglobulin domain-containing protein 1-like [Thunnus maccoyii]